MLASSGNAMKILTETESSFPIIENDSLIIQTITNMDFKEDGSEFLINTLSSGVLRFSVESGEIIEHILPTNQIYDIVADSETNPNIYPGDTCRFLKYHEIKKLNSNWHDYIKIKYKCSQYFNEKIIHYTNVGTVKQYISPTNNKYVKKPIYENERVYRKMELAEEIQEMLSSRAPGTHSLRSFNTLISDNLTNDSLGIIPLTNLQFEFVPNNTSFFINDSNIFVSSYNFGQSDDYVIGDSIICISRYNSKGRFTNIAETYPEKFGESGVMFSLYGDAPICEVDSQVYVTHKFHDSIICMTNRNLDIPLKKLAYGSTNRVFEFGNLYKRYIKEDKEVPYNEVCLKLPVVNRNIFPINQNIGIYSEITKVSDGNPQKYRCVTQIYNLAGKLIDELDFKPINSNGEINHLDYNENNNCFYVIRKSKSKGWTIEVIKWGE